jgi:4-hydroxy-4-methyl-2-oxoglutarate aldolase
MKTVVVRNIPRADPALVAALNEAGTATVHEAMGRIGLMKPYMRPIYAGAAMAGSAVTVLVTPGDNWMIHVGIEHCKPGDVMVVACTADNTDGMVGELIATSLMAHGVKGMVLDVGCRDVRVLTEMKFPVWSRAISAKGAVKSTLGNVNLPVVCAGVSVEPGDIVVADDDGVVVVPLADAQRVSKLAKERMDKESAVRKRYEKGELSLDINNMRGTLEQLGLRYVDNAADLDKEAK